MIVPHKCLRNHVALSNLAELQDLFAVQNRIKDHTCRVELSNGQVARRVALNEEWGESEGRKH